MNRMNNHTWASALARNYHTLLTKSDRLADGCRDDLARATHRAKFRLIEVSIGTYSFPYWHAFGVDDAAISHKQSLAHAKWCSRRGSLFLSTNGSFFVIAEGKRIRNQLYSTVPTEGYSTANIIVN